MVGLYLTIHATRSCRVGSCKVIKLGTQGQLLSPEFKSFSNLSNEHKSSFPTLWPTHSLKNTENFNNHSQHKKKVKELSLPMSIRKVYSFLNMGYLFTQCPFKTHMLHLLKIPSFPPIYPMTAQAWTSLGNILRPFFYLGRLLADTITF